MKLLFTLAALAAALTFGGVSASAAPAAHAVKPAHVKVAAVQPAAPACCAGGDCCKGGSCCAMPGCCAADGSCCNPATGVCTAACGCPGMSAGMACCAR